MRKFTILTLIKMSKIYYGWLIVGALFLSSAIGVGTRQGFGVFVDTWGGDWEVNVWPQLLDG